MKIQTFTIGLGLLGVGASIAQERPQKPPMQEAVTQEELVLQYRKAQLEDPMKKLDRATGEDPSVVNRPPSLLGNSDFITFGKFSTLVPKRAILQIPKSLTERVNAASLTRIVGWAEFYAANRGWITTIEVSRSQAEGNVPLAEETHDQMKKNGNLIVATYQGGPISLLPLKVPEEKKLTTQTP